jgi:hypothetical protein
MTREERIAAEVAKLPEGLKRLHDLELSRGGTLNAVEFGRGADQGKVQLQFQHPFHIQPSDAREGVLYRENSNQHLTIFEFYTPDERVSLITAKFKPMKLDPLPPGPENPTAAHIKRMRQREREDEEARARRATEADAERAAKAFMPSAEVQAAKAGLKDPVQRFVASMTMTYDMWHDGVGYDLQTLAAATPKERAEIERVLISRRPRDWRDVEALAQIDSPAARAAVEAALKDPDPQVRREAMRYASDKVDPADRERRLLALIPTAAPFGGLTEALDDIEEFHPPSVIDAMLRATLRGDGEAAVHFAAMLFYLHGKAAEPFDWSHRPFFLRFNTTDRAERCAAFEELCRVIGVDATKFG